MNQNMMLSMLREPHRIRIVVDRMSHRLPILQQLTHRATIFLTQERLVKHQIVHLVCRRKLQQRIQQTRNHQRMQCQLL